MCTLSWLPLPGGYAVAMNRDERRNRAPARPPGLVLIGGVPVLMPVDGEAGGTWIAVNALGHTLALLNRYEESPQDPDAFRVSRGLLVTALAGLPPGEAVADALGGLRLEQYRPFTLASIPAAGSPRLFEWDGRALIPTSAAAPGLLRTSSGRDQAGAERERGELFRQAALAPEGLTPESMIALHRSHRPERGPLSICMHREEAVTVSSSLITVSVNQLLFRYVIGSPCVSGAVSELALPRSGVPQP